MNSTTSLLATIANPDSAPSTAALQRRTALQRAALQPNGAAQAGTFEELLKQAEGIRLEGKGRDPLDSLDSRLDSRLDEAPASPDADLAPSVESDQKADLPNWTATEPERQDLRAGLGLEARSLQLEVEPQSAPAEAATTPARSLSGAEDLASRASQTTTTAPRAGLPAVTPSDPTGPNAPPATATAAPTGNGGPATVRDGRPSGDGRAGPWATTAGVMGAAGNARPGPADPGLPDAPSPSTQAPRVNLAATGSPTAPRPDFSARSSDEQPLDRAPLPEATSTPTSHPEASPVDRIRAASPSLDTDTRRQASIQAASPSPAFAAVEPATASVVASVVAANIPNRAATSPGAAVAAESAGGTNRPTSRAAAERSVAASQAMRTHFESEFDTARVQSNAVASGVLGRGTPDDRAANSASNTPSGTVNTSAPSAAGTAPGGAVPLPPPTTSPTAGPVPTAPNPANETPSTAWLATADHREQLGTAMTDDAFPRVLGMKIGKWTQDGVQRVWLDVHPADMGPVAIQIALDGRQAELNFGVESAAARAVIEASLPELAASLQSAGLTLSGGSIAQDMPRSSAGSDSSANPGATNRSVSGSPGGEPAAVAAAAPRQPRGLVDLYA